MELLSRAVVIECGILLGGFFAVVLYKIAIGEISLAGLLYTKERGAERTFSPARLQLLIFTVVVAADYLHALATNPRPGSFPDLPQGVVAALGGSQALYVGSKVLSTYIKPLHRKST